MNTNKHIIQVSAKNIDRGIERYGGVIDNHLQNLIKSAGLEYTPYKFVDGRILLVLPNKIAGILYPDMDSVIENINLE